MTLTVLLNPPTFVALNIKVNVTLVPLAKSPIAQTLVVELNVPFEGSASINTNPLGTISLTVTFVALVALAALLTTIVNVISLSTSTISLSTPFVMFKSTYGSTSKIF